VTRGARLRGRLLLHPQRASRSELASEQGSRAAVRRDREEPESDLFPVGPYPASSADAFLSFAYASPRSDPPAQLRVWIPQPVASREAVLLGRSNMPNVGSVDLYRRG